MRQFVEIMTELLVKYTSHNKLNKVIIEIKCQVLWKIFPIILTLICLIQLFLTRTSEIVDSPSDPHYRRNKHPSKYRAQN